MKTFEQWFDEAWYTYDTEKGIGETRGAIHNCRNAWNACDQAWREELAKDRGVKGFDEWWSIDGLVQLDTSDKDYRKIKIWSHETWTTCETLWRHKCLNIEQASQMKIAILERQIEELKKDLSLCLDRMECAEWEKDIKETRQRHKLDEGKA